MPERVVTKPESQKFIASHVAGHDDRNRWSRSSEYAESRKVFGKAVSGTAGAGRLEVVDQYRDIQRRMDIDQQVHVIGFPVKLHELAAPGGETKTAGAATRQVKVCDPRNPRYNDARSLAVAEFIPS